MKKKQFQDIVPPSRQKKGASASVVSAHKQEEKREEEAPVVAPAPVSAPKSEYMTANQSSVHKENTARFLGDKERMPFWNGYRSSPGVSPHKHTRSRGYSLYTYAVCAVGLVALVFIGLSFLSRGATITVYPRTAPAFVDGSFIISQKETPGMLTFAIVEKTATVSKEIPATGVARVEERARGTIRIQNTFSTSPQRLIKNTRFVSPEGFVFRIPESVEVPGMTRAADGTEKPGEIETPVAADEAGEKYNIGPSTFTIPGFSGTPRHSKITAQSSSPMRGGFIGERATIAASVRTEAESALRAELVEKLKAEADALRIEQAEDVFVYDTAQIVYAPPMERAAGGKNATLELSGTLRIAHLEGPAFAEYLAGETLASYDRLPIELTNAKDLSITLLPIENTLAEQLPWSEESMRLKVSGTAHFVWLFDETRFKADLVGKEESAFPTILRSYPGIGRAEVASRPFWSDTLPTDIGNISLKIKLDFEEEKR